LNLIVGKHPLGGFVCPYLNFLLRHPSAKVGKTKKNNSRYDREMKPPTLVAVGSICETPSLRNHLGTMYNNKNTATETMSNDYLVVHIRGEEVFKNHVETG
jgi:hypothetical protein